MQPWFTVCFSDTGHPCHDQLTPVKTRYLLPGIMWAYHGLKFAAGQGHLLFAVDRWPSVSFPLDRRLMSGWLLKTGQDFLKVIHFNPGLKVNQITTFSSVYGIIETRNNAKQYTENLTAKLQNSNQNSTFSWVSLIGHCFGHPRYSTSSKNHHTLCRFLLSVYSSFICEAN